MKEYRKEELKFYILGNIIVILVLSDFMDVYITQKNKNMVEFMTVLFGSSLLASLIYIYSYIIDAMIPAQWKDKIIFFFKDKPGNTVFTNIRDNNKDTRFSSKDALVKYEHIYKEIDILTEHGQKTGVYQNAEWYKIYCCHSEDESVWTAQRDFLLNRDMCVMTIVVFIISLIIHCIGIIHLKCIIYAFFTIEVLSTRIASYNKAKRFIYNVIANDLGSLKNKN